MKNYEKLAALVAAMKNDFEKFYDKGNGAAGTRVRKGMQELTAFAKATRKEVITLRQARAAEKKQP